MSGVGPGPFDNDSALDLLDELGERPGDVEGGVRDALTRVLGGRFDGLAMDRGLAAACLVAARVAPGVMDSPDGAEFLEERPFEVDDELRGLARKVFARAFDAKDNEWYALWDEVGALPDIEIVLAPYRKAL